MKYFLGAWQLNIYEAFVASHTSSEGTIISKAKMKDNGQTAQSLLTVVLHVPVFTDGSCVIVRSDYTSAYTCLIAEINKRYIK